MSKVTDYSKWNIIEDDDDCEEERASEHSLVTFQKFDALKLDADKLFAAAECSRDPYDYKIALNQGYLISLEELIQLSQHTGNKREEIIHFEIACKLNIACCHLKLMELQDTIDVCTSVLTDYQKIMSEDQMIRLRYFRGYSYCKLGSEENLFLAESDATQMKRMLASMQTIHGPFVTEYRDFFQMLHQDRQKYLALDELIQAESAYFKSGMGSAVQSKKGWEFYVQRNFTLSSDWFAGELLDLRKRSVDEAPNKDLFCDRHCGYGKSQLALNNHLEAAKAFLAAASYTDVTETKVSLNLRAASLCFKEGEYERAVSSYATALVLAEDSLTSTESEKNIPSDCPVSNADTQLMIAVANVGLGMSYVKMKECSRALEHLKAGIGFLTDEIFIKQKSSSQKNFPFTCPDTLMTFTPVEASHNEGDKNPSSFTLPMIISRTHHLLNALESLSDAYADLQEWEKAVYTANTSASVCNGLLEQLLLKDSTPTMTFTDDGTPNGSLAVRDNSSNIDNSNNDNNNSSSSSSGSGNSTSSKRCTLLLKDDITAVLNDEFCEKLKNDCLEVERENFVSTVRKKRASALHAKGHMMKQMLHHDVSRNTVKGGGKEKDTLNIGPRPFDSMDNDLSLERFYYKSVYDTTSSNTSPADAITDLWTEAASEFNEVGDHENALLIYTDLAAMWEGLGRIKPYCDSLYRIEERPIHVHTAHQDLSDTASNTTPSSSKSSSSSMSVTDTAVLSGDIRTNDNDDSSHQIALPLKPFTPEGVRRIYAAKKASSLWLVAADVASSLCLKASSTSTDDSSRVQKDTELSDPSSSMVSEDVTSLEIQMTLCQQVIQCQYKSGLCALFYDIVEAEQLLGRAQASKEKYQDLAGSLEVAERGRRNSQNSSGSNTLLKDASSSISGEIRKAKWMNYNMLCCDISYHLAYAYIRLERIVYAIAEAEMAIGYAVQLPRGKEKERRRLCWGVLALAFHVSGQVLDTDRAMSEARSLQSNNALDENDDILKALSAYMKFIKVKKRIPIPSSSDIASKYSQIKPEIASNYCHIKPLQSKEPLIDLQSDQSSTSNTSHCVLNKKTKHSLNLFSYQAVAAFFFLLLALLISFFNLRL